MTPEDDSPTSLVPLGSDSQPSALVATFNPDRLAGDLEGAARRAGRAKSPNTLRAYTSAWATFQTYCTLNDSTSLPAHPVTVAAFLEWRAVLPVSQHGEAPHTPGYSTVMTSFSAIAHYHHVAGLQSPTDHPQVQAVLEGITRDLGKRAKHPKVPVLIEDLLRLLDAHTADEGIAWKRDWAVLTIGFASALRRSNLAALRVEDAEFHPRGVHLLARRGKTDQTGEGRWIGILRRPKLCPVRALEAWMAAGQITEGPLFRSLTKWGTPRASMAEATVDEITKRHMQALGYKGEAYGAHSLRSGFATEASLRGKSLKQIMDQGGWDEPKTAQRYMRKATLLDDNPTDMLP